MQFRDVAVCTRGIGPSRCSSYSPGRGGGEGDLQCTG